MIAKEPILIPPPNEAENLQRQARSGGLKLSNKASTFNAALEEKAEQKKWFEAQSQLSFDTKEARKESASILVAAYWESFNSKVLETQKGPSKIAMEKKIIDDLLIFAQEADADATEEVLNCGSLSLLSLVLRGIKKIQERQNKFDYRLTQLEQK